MSNRRRGWGIQPPTQIGEQKATGILGELVLPALQALVITAGMFASLLISAVALWAGEPALRWLVTLCASVALVIYLILYDAGTWMRLAQVIVGLTATALASWSFGHVIHWLVDAELPSRTVMLILWCLVPGAWIGFALLLVAFAWELFLRSPAMEEHGFREFFSWLFTVFLTRPRPVADVSPNVHLAEITYQRTPDSGKRIERVNVPVPEDTMKAVAALVLDGKNFSEPVMVRDGGPLKATEFKKLKAFLLKRQLVRVVDPSSKTSGVEMTYGGLSFMRAYLPVEEKESDV